MRFLILATVVWTANLWGGAGWADEVQRGRLLIVGGGLRPDNRDVFERLIKYAGGEKSARVGILPTAAKSGADAEQTKLILTRMGVPANQVQVINLYEANASTQVANPQIIEQIRSCSGIYFEGGDQTRITRALFDAHGSPTPALQAIYDIWNKGAVIAGSSAGAAVQSRVMISAGGLPDAALDEGMDSLDFGLTTKLAHRGLFVSRGLGFFEFGIIDQHFGQYRGRLGRLTRAVVENRPILGFGIDENTALDVAADGACEVVGAGTVTVVDGAGARLEDGPFGCRISGVRLTLLDAGDRFDARSGRSSPRAGKKRIVPGQEEYNGNFLIPDVHGRGGVLDAMIGGLADNTSRKQVTVALKHNQHYAHGYRFTFRKTDSTECYGGFVEGLYSYSVIGVILDIEPVDGTLRAAEKCWPSAMPKRISAVFHRGILLADENRNLRLTEPITRAELAGAIAQTVHLEPSRGGETKIRDVSEEAPFANEIALVAANGIMEVDQSSAFHGDRLVDRAEGAIVLVRLAERYRQTRLSRTPIVIADLEKVPESKRAAVFAAMEGGLLNKEGQSFLPDRPLSRQETAEAVHRIIGFPW